MAGSRQNVIFGQGLDITNDYPNISNQLGTDGFLYFGNSAGRAQAGLPTSINDTIGYVGTNGGGRFENRRWLTSFVVDPSASEGSRGTYQTIQAAVTAASSGDTIFVRPGTYTEDVTLKAGVNIVAFESDAQTPNVTIVGKLSASFAGTASISGVRLQTNSDFFLAVTGSSATIINLLNCDLRCSNNTGISFTSSSSSSKINIKNCSGDITTTGITFFAHSASGTLALRETRIDNSGVSATHSTVSAGALTLDYCYLGFSITTSGSSLILESFCEHNVGNGEAALTMNASGSNNTLRLSHFASGSASAISVGASSILNISTCTFDSTNASTITGTGTLRYSTLSMATATGSLNLDAGLTLDSTPRRTLTGGVSFDGGSNLLSYYETGTWTPVLEFGGGSTGITYLGRAAKYTRIGNTVSIKVDVSLSNKGSSTGSARITGLPFTSSNDANTQDLFMVGANLPAPANTTIFYAEISPNVTNALLAYADVDAGTNNALSDSDFQNNSTVRLSGTYFV